MLHVTVIPCIQNHSLDEDAHGVIEATRHPSLPAFASIRIYSIANNLLGLRSQRACGQL